MKKLLIALAALTLPVCLSAQVLTQHIIQPQDAAQTFGAVNSIISVCSQAGATALIPSGGTVDARCYASTTQSIAATVSLSAGQTLVTDPATKFQPASATVNMFTIAPNSTLYGVWLDFANLSANSYVGTAIKFVGQFTDGQNTALQNFRITALGQNTVGTGILFSSASAADTVAFVTVAHGRIYGMNSGLKLAASGTGWINGNLFEDVVVEASANGYVFANTSSDVIEGNQFINCAFQAGSSTTAGVLTTGSGFIQRNLFTNLVIWDTIGGGQGVPFLFSDTNTLSNQFRGRFDGTITNPYNLFVNSLGQTTLGNVNMTGAFGLIGNLVLNGKHIGSTGAAALLQGGAGSTYDLLVSDTSGSFNLLSVLDTGDIANKNGTVIPVATTGAHGNGVKIQYSDNTGTSGNLAKFDAGGNTVDGGISAASVTTALTKLPLVAALVTTAAATDNVTVTGMTSSGHCALTPTNAAAATNLATTYVSAKTTNQITVAHTATASMNYDVLCTAF
jgi:hypothetical protein